MGQAVKENCDSFDVPARKGPCQKLAQPRGRQLTEPPRLNRAFRSPWVSVALLVIAMGSMQLGAAFAKGLFTTLGAQGATALRLTFSALMLAVVQCPWRVRGHSRTVMPLIAYGVSLGAMNSLFYLALRTTPLGVAIALEFIGPLSLAILSSRQWRDAVWVALAVVGLALLIPFGKASHPLDPVGAMLALASGFCWAVYIVFGRRVGHALGARGTALGMIVAALVFAPIGAASAGPGLFAPAAIGSGVLLALLSSALPYSLEMVALTHLPARAFGTLMSLEPAVGALAGLAVLHESPSPMQWGGIAAVIAASAGTTLTLHPRPSEA